MVDGSTELIMLYKSNKAFRDAALLARKGQMTTVPISCGQTLWPIKMKPGSLETCLEYSCVE